METLAAHPDLLYVGVVGLTCAAGMVLFLLNKILRKVN